MPSLFGRFWTRRELQNHVGDMRQVAGIQSATLTGGRAAGVRALEFTVGDGLRFTVLPDRCMDIPYLEYRGVPLVWASRTGIVSPHDFDDRGRGWLRSFSGGLLATCGLTQVGQPCLDGDEALGLHGRIGNTPAEDVSTECMWDGDDYIMRCGGMMREARVFGEDLRLFRQIEVRAGSRTIHLRDRVENRGAHETPFMLLYHCNFGFPLLSPDARALFADEHVEPKDEPSRQGMAELTRYGPPQRDWSEQNYWHDPRTNENGECQAAIVNETVSAGARAGVGVALTWRKDQLKMMVQWKQLGCGDYVTAMEPANCHTMGRVWERENGTLEYLAPGEVRHFELSFTILAGGTEIQAFEQRLLDVAR